MQVFVIEKHCLFSLRSLCNNSFCIAASLLCLIYSIWPCSEAFAIRRSGDDFSFPVRLCHVLSLQDLSFLQLCRYYMQDLSLALVAPI
jgi:hypothetical protein